MLLDLEDSQLVLLDQQERLLPALLFAFLLRFSCTML